MSDVGSDGPVVAFAVIELLDQLLQLVVERKQRLLALLAHNIFPMGLFLMGHYSYQTITNRAPNM